MSDYRALQERYEKDPAFYHMVKALENAIETLHLTPSEIRDAAMFACMRFELTHAKSIVRQSGYGITPRSTYLAEED